MMRLFLAKEKKIKMRRREMCNIFCKIIKGENLFELKASKREKRIEEKKEITSSLHPALLSSVSRREILTAYLYGNL